MPRAFRGLRAPPRDSYDAVIVGAGIGGLVCANLLARAGLSVLLVEQHYMVGGYCSTFRRCGCTFDAATHFYPLLGNPSTISGRLLVELGIHCGWIQMDPVDHFHFPDGSEFRVPASLARYLAQLKAEFPDEKSGIDDFFELAREAYVAGLVFHFRGRDNPRLDAFRQWSVRDALDRFFTDPKLKLLLTADCSHWGAPPSRTSFVFDSMLRLAYFLGNYYPAGGSQVFADALAARFEQRGGEVLMSSRVTRILTRGRRARGVELETGFGRRRTTCSVFSDYVVSNADLVLTLEDLLGPQIVGPAQICAVKNMSPSRPVFIHHAAIDGITAEELEKVDGYHWNCWDSERVVHSSIKIFVPTLYDAGIAPPGRQIIIAQKLSDVNYGEVGDWAAETSREQARILALLRQVIPDYDRRVVWQASASAYTSHRFTLNHQGAMLGWEMSPQQLGAYRPDVSTTLEGLYFTGHWTQPGGGITPVIVSASRVADQIVQARNALSFAETSWLKSSDASLAMNVSRE
jgi:phytoene dehydrogenase-like protein